MAHRNANAADPGITVLERGWLSSNNVLLHGSEGEDAVLVDTGHVVHAAQTLALVAHALAGARLARIVNTHLHSDHCGGNAALQAAHDGCRIATPAASFAAARDWDPDVLSYKATGQLCDRFRPDEAIAPGDAFTVGGRRWQALAAPGHDPDSLVFFDGESGMLISADALWEDGFGVVFPELDGGDGFDDVQSVLDSIDSLRPRRIIPGHGAPFDDVPAALGRARRRLAGFRADPARHAEHAARVLVKYHLMERQRATAADFDAWFSSTPLCEAVWARLGRPGGSLAGFGRRIVDELVDRGAISRGADGSLADR